MVTETQKPKTISVIVPADLAARIEGAAKAEGRSVSNLLNRVIAPAFPEIATKKEKEDK